MSQQDSNLEVRLNSYIERNDLDESLPDEESRLKVMDCMSQFALDAVHDSAIQKELFNEYKTNFWINADDVFPVNPETESNTDDE